MQKQPQKTQKQLKKTQKKSNILLCFCCVLFESPAVFLLCFFEFPAVFFVVCVF